VASPPKNTRNPSRACEAEDRRLRTERRDPERGSDYAGPERRQGPRRKADLRRPLWQQPISVLLAAGLGVLAAVNLDRLPGFEPEPPAMIEPTKPAQQPPIAAHTEIIIDPEQLAAAQAMRDEAERLTLAAVTLDERTHERWLPRIARIEAVRADPTTPQLVRAELDATVAALARVGLL
jgi:hypothetical protein